MGKPKSPSPPSPQETSAAQTGTNVATSVANTVMGNANQYSPYGSSVSYQTGEYDFTDPYTGQTYKIPMFSTATTLSPGEQGIYDYDVDARTNLAGTAADQSAFVRDYLSQPFQGDTAAIEERLGELYSSRMDPQFARDEDALRTRLTQQGLTPGSAAWDAEMERFGQNKNDARVQTMLQGRGQAFGELQALRNQPLNEIIGLLSGSQINAPNQMGFQAAGIPTTDNAGLIMDNYNNQMAQYQQQMASRNSLLGGLFGLGAKAISGGIL